MAVSRHVSHYHYSHYHYFFITAPFIFNPGTFLYLWYLSQNMKGPINKYFHTILLRADLLQNELEFLLFLAPEIPLASSFLDVIITVISLPRQEFLPLFSAPLREMSEFTEMVTYMYMEDHTVILCCYFFFLLIIQQTTASSSYKNEQSAVCY